MPPEDSAPAAGPVLMVAGRPDPLPLAGRSGLLVGRSARADLSFPDDASCSREQLRLVRHRDGWVVEPLSQSVPTLLNGAQIDGPAALADGDEIAFSDQRLRFAARSAAVPPPPPPPDAGAPGPEATQVLARGDVFRREADRSSIPAERPAGPPPDRTTFAARESLADTRALDADIPLTADARIGRDANAVDIVLDHPAVSRAHAEVRVRSGQVWLRDLNSSNGTFVNGERLSRRRQLQPGDSVDIGPYSLRFTGQSFARSSRVGNIRIVARNLVREVPSEGGGRARILDDVSLVIEPNEFVCLLGPSGSGKTTLMNALSARYPADSGHVAINDVGLYQNFDLLKEDIALVPQHDVLHEELTLAEALGYTAKLRLPADTPLGALQGEVTRVVQSVELEHRLNTPIARFSGGQKKRASLANETVIQPSLLFLDEVTSGLDEGTDWEMMRLFRQMADRGVTVVCVTHTLANVEEFCHKVAIMANPGVLVFYGSPAEALAFFRVDKLADIYRELPRKPAGEWQLEFEESEYYRRYIEGPLGAGPRRPAGGAADDEDETATMAPTRLPDAGSGGGIAETVRQFGILTRRYTKLLLSDRKTLGIALAQSAVIGLLLALVFGTYDSPDPRDSSLLFLLGISAFWLGCNNASKEIVKERPIYRRERDVNLSVLSYLSAKMVVFGAFAVVMVAILFLITLLFSQVPGSNLGQLGMMAMSALVGTALGLLISAATNTRDQANTMVPMALIPQIVLAGVIVPDLPVVPDVLAHVAISGFWTFDGMTAVLQDGVGDALAAFIVLAVHLVVFFGAAFVILLVRDSRSQRPAAMIRSTLGKAQRSRAASQPRSG
jgi:ABC-type multidrug transport system ATPase subunit